MTGIWLAGPGRTEAESRAAAMAGALRHRGPDADGAWADPAEGIALAHRRLSILELSPAGAQPMISPSGRHVLSFNGEIYNHQDLRARIGAPPGGWRGGSDTETLLAAIESWGLETALERAAGMFALALWDRQARTLALARDRMGEKPLHVARLSGGIAVASEIKAFHACPCFEARLRPGAVAEFLRLGYVPDDTAIFDGVSKVVPGTVMRFAHPAATPEVTAYWHLADTVADARAHPRAETGIDDLARATEETLAEVISEQMLSDVPLGAFLSGGIDSTLITALMQAGAAGRVRSFSIGFEEARFDESRHAARIAAHLGTEHTAFTVREADALALIPELPRIYDEPFGDPSALPTTLLCRLARREVTVALTGDGGDEIFGGYNRHVMGPGLWRRLSRVPPALRRAIPALARLLHRAGGAEGARLRPVFDRLGLPATTLDKLTALAPVLARAPSPEALYHGLAASLPEPGAVLAPGLRGAGRGPAGPEVAGLSFAEWMMLADSLAYLPGDILVKVDRAAMDSSLESRAPYLDPRVVRLGWSLPREARIAGGVGKRVLRTVLARHVPPQLVERPKQGFAIPLDRWLRGALRGWAEELLAPDRLAAGGLLAPGPVRHLWTEHLAGRANHGAKLWTLLMLEAWREAWLARP